MAKWDYRVLKTNKDGFPKESWEVVFRYYLNDEGQEYIIFKNKPPSASSMDELKRCLKDMSDALDKPIIEE